MNNYTEVDYGEISNEKINELEKSLEGKTILNITFNPSVGICIRFTNGFVFKMFVDGFNTFSAKSGKVIYYDESKS